MLFHVGDNGLIMTDPVLSGPGALLPGRQKHSAFRCQDKKLQKEQLAVDVPAAFSVQSFLEDLAEEAVEGGVLGVARAEDMGKCQIMIQERPCPLLLPFVRVGKIQNVRAKEDYIVNSGMAQTGKLVQFFAVYEDYVPLFQAERFQIQLAEVGAFPDQDKLYVGVPMALHEKMVRI